MFISKTKKSPYYQLTYEVNGKRTTISTKTKNLQEAKYFMKNFKIPSKKTKTPKVEVTTLSKFQNEYSEFMKSSKSKSYIKSINLSFRMLIKFTGDISLNQLDLKTLDQFISQTYSRTQRGALLYYRSLKAAFSKAVVWNYLSDNPLKKIKAPKVSKAFPVFISEEELQLIIDHTFEQYLKDFFLIAFYTGMRLGELVNMKWNWIDFEQNLITVKCSEEFHTKSKKERIIPMCKKLRECLSNHRSTIKNYNKNNFVFIRRYSIKFNEDFISKKFKKAIRRAGLNDKIHFHTLRHSFASVLVQKGASLFVVKELLGHEDLKTTQIYSHLQQQNLMEAVLLL